jgi:hypothetical protein
MWAFPDRYNRNGELWAVMLAILGLVSMESNDERWPYGIHFSFYGRPSELVFLDLEGFFISPIAPRRTFVDERFA